MKIKFLHSIILCLLVLVIACEEEINWDIQTDNTIRLVVDGILTNENITHCIKLSITNQKLNASSQPLSGASVYVTNGNNIFEFSESESEPGSYYSLPFRAVVDIPYSLNIQYESYVFEARATGVSVTPIEEPVFSVNGGNNLYRYVYSESGNAAMMDVFYNWQDFPDYCSEYGSCSAMETFYTLENIDVNKIYAPDKQIIWFPKGTTIIRKKYSLSEDHQNFLRSLLMETEWSGGLFDVQHGNVSTNLSKGALGYFAVCMVVTDTIYVN